LSWIAAWMRHDASARHRRDFPDVAAPFRRRGRPVRRSRVRVPTRTEASASKAGAPRGRVPVGDLIGRPGDLRHARSTLRIGWKEVCMVVSSHIRDDRTALPVAMPPERTKVAREQDAVERVLLDSFPASDPPVWLIVAAGGPRRTAPGEAGPWDR
jgi:hypothetical protein